MTAAGEPARPDRLDDEDGATPRTAGEITADEQQEQLDEGPGEHGASRWLWKALSRASQAGVHGEGSV